MIGSFFRRIVRTARIILSVLSNPLLNHRKGLSDIPNELLLGIAANLELTDLNSLLRTNRSFSSLLSPVLHKLAVKTRGKDGRSILHWASSSGRTSLVSFLLQHGASTVINIADNDGFTSLHRAVLSSRVGVVKLLLQNGAKTEIVDGEGWTALHLSVLTNNTLVVGLLLENGADIDVKSLTSDRKTAFHYATLFGYTAVAKLLIEKGADVGAKDSRGITAAQGAVIASHGLLLDCYTLIMDVLPSDDMYRGTGHDLYLIRSKIGRLLRGEWSSRENWRKE